MAQEFRALVVLADDWVQFPALTTICGSIPRGSGITLSPHVVSHTLTIEKIQKTGEKEWRNTQ